VTIDLASYAGATDLGDGWFQLAVPFSEFSNPEQIPLHSGWLLGPPGDQADATFTFLLTDVGFSNVGGGAVGSTEIAQDGGFETASLMTDNWIVDPVGGTGTATLDSVVFRTGAKSAHLVNVTPQGPPLIIKQANLGLGAVATGATVNVSYWAKGAIGNTCAVTTKLIYEGSGASTPDQVTTVETANLADWAEITLSGTAVGDVAGGITLEITSACGLTTAGVDINIDDLTVTYSNP
jgi:hypothetical protein